MQAPMQPQKMAPVGPESGIPLTCTACSTKPKFSDISHLLTHVNSKGHLHAYQQLKIRALSDLSASATLVEYNQWYEDNDIEKLLADRLAQRDERAQAEKKRKAAKESEAVSILSLA